MGKRSALKHGVALFAFTLLFCVILAPAAFAALVSVDNGFESGTDGVTLSSSVWTAVNSPQRYEYDGAQAKNGVLAGWVQGPTVAGQYAGVRETASAGMSADGAEVRFWLYFENTTQMRFATGTDAGTVVSTFWLRWNSDGTLGAYTNKVGITGYTTGAYTPVGTYATGWTQYRVVYDFSNQGYQLYQRANEGDAWTALKSAGAPDYTIPFRGTGTVTASDGSWFRAAQNVNMWIDDVAYSDYVPPVITVDGVTDGQSGPEPVTITFSANDEIDGPVPATATLDGDPFTSGTEVADPGDYTLVVASTDSAGNTATTTIDFTIEEPPPPAVSTSATAAWSIVLVGVVGLGLLAIRRRRLHA